jgi:hypothetical protein
VHLRVPVLVAASLFALAVCAEPLPSPNSEVLDHYLAASEVSQTRLRGFAMEVEMDGELPKLKKQGRLHALRHISALGRITYDALKWAGDNTIKIEVIARYLKAEVQATDGPDALAITPANYKFKYKGKSVRGQRMVHIFELNPRKKRVGLFKGELWVDADTYLPVREAGQFVKTPSVFLKKMQFVRNYEIHDGIAFPSRIESVVDTRIVGRAELNISFTNFSRQETESPVAANTGESQ